MINKLKRYDLNCSVFNSYDYADCLDLNSLLCRFFTKINECIEASNKALTFMEWLKEVGLKQEVVTLLGQWKDDGTLAELISEQILTEIKQNIANNQNAIVELQNKEQKHDIKLRELEDRSLNLEQKIVSINSKLELNVWDFGALGGEDNALEDTKAFKKCFELANKTHKNVIIPQGVYYINEPLSINGTYKIKGFNSKLVCNKDNETFITLSKTIENLNLMNNIYDSGFNYITLEGNGKCNTTLHIRQGKGINVEGLVCRGGKKYSCLLGSNDGNTWELSIKNTEFNADLPGGGQGDYALYMYGNLSDNFFSDIYCINGRLGWGYIKTSSSSLTNIHGYSYPEDKACETGFTVYSSATTLDKIICDTPRKVGIEINGNGCTLNNVSVGKYTDLEADELIACLVKAPNTIISGIEGGTDVNQASNRVTVVKLDTETNPSINDFKCSNIMTISKPKKDINVTGKIPYRFDYDKYVNVEESIKDNNFLHYNIVFYSGNTTRKISFKNVMPTTLYSVTLYEITNKAIPKYKILNEVDGFTIEFVESVTETLNLTAYMTLN